MTTNDIGARIWREGEKGVVVYTEPSELGKGERASYMRTGASQFWAINWGC